MSGPAPFPFIVGAARSGTTLLRAMLDSHPELAVTPESHFLFDLLSLGDGSEDRARLEALRRHEQLAPWPFRTPLGAELARGAPWPAPHDIAMAARLLYQSYAASRGKPRWGDKTPSHSGRIPALAEWFPESVFVHLVRDGRDVAASLAESSFGPRRVLTAAHGWERHVMAARSAGRRLGDRYLEVRYERLVEDPEGTLVDVCELIDLPYQPSMLQFAERIDEILDGVTNIPDHPNLGRGLQRHRDWRRDLSRPLLAAVEHQIGAALDELDYPRSGVPFGVRARVVEGAHRLRAPAGAARARSVSRRCR